MWYIYGTFVTIWLNISLREKTLLWLREVMVSYHYNWSTKNHKNHGGCDHMHQNFQTGRRPLARGSTRGGGDAPAGLWALCPGRSRSWSRRAAPGSPSLQNTRSPSAPSPPSHGKPLSQPSLRPLHPSIPPRSVGCGCRSLQGGSPLLITDAKVIRSPRCVSISIPA